MNIRSVAQKYGICKIIPPSTPTDWLHENTFEKNVNNDTFIFQTKVQNVRELARRGVSDSFLHQLSSFMEERRIPLNQSPKLKQYRIQYYRLFKEVVQRGGFENVTKNQQWSEILTAIDIPVTQLHIDEISRLYYMNLLPFEQENLEINSENENHRNHQQQQTLLSSSPSSSSQTNSPKKVQHIGMRAVKLDPHLRDLVNELNKSSDDNISTGDDDEEGFGFPQGKVYSLKGFKKQANRFARKWFNIPPGDPIYYTEERVFFSFQKINVFY